MSTKARTSNSSRASTRIAIGFAALALAGYFGYQYWSSLAIDKEEFPPLTPSRVNVVGIDTSKGYRIVVANQIAQVIEGSTDKFEAQVDESASIGEKKRVPIGDMLQAMQGNVEALSRFVMAVNDMKEDDLPPARVYWTAADVRKAIAGDTKLRTKLESDLNVKLDGTPLSLLRPAVLDTGIVVKAPVEIRVPSEAGSKTMVATVLVPYEARMMKAVFRRIAEKPEIDKAIMLGTYQDEARALQANPALKEDVAKSLTMLVSKASLQEKARLPEKVLSSIQVVINDTHIESATYERKEGSEGAFHNIRLRLSDEGRRRLWKYSRGRVGSQLLLVVKGVAIAAPAIAHELSQRDLTITQIALDERLVKDNVDMINNEARS